MKKNPGILPGIDHVVVLMLENRSFDTMLGWLYDGGQPRHFIPRIECGRFEGLYDAELPQYEQPLTFPDGNRIWVTPVKGATYNQDGGATYLDSPPTDPHETQQYVTDQIYGPLGGPMVNPPPGAEPKMKGFLQDYASLWEPSTWRTNLALIEKIMETYTPAQVPNLCWLARQYACSDMWFSSVPTQTNPNRAFLAAGTSLGQINNADEGYSVFDTDTIWNRLDTVNVDWKIFWEEPYLPLPDSTHPSWTRQAFPRLPQPGTRDGNFPSIAEFHRLARAGQLPTFSFIEPSWTLEVAIGGVQGDDFHPPGDVRPGEDLLGQIYTSLIANPDAFQRTLLVITFDEHGGTFDHWPPPRAVPPDNHDQEGFGFGRYGARVPTLFVSPWIEPETVIRAGLPGSWPPFDHTSVNATVLKWIGFAPHEYGLGARTEQAPSFEAVLNRTTPTAPASWIPGGPRRQPGAPVKLGDRFYLRCASGPSEGQWLSAAKWSGFPYDAWYPTLSPSSPVALSFTWGDSNLAMPPQVVTHGSFLYIRSNESAVQGGPYFDTGSAVTSRGDVYYAGDAAPTVPAPALYWTIKLADQTMASLGQPVQYGDVVTLESRFIPSAEYWLPGKLKPKGDGYLTLSTDAEYGDADVGSWVIVPA